MSVQLLGTSGFFTRAGSWIGEFNRISAFYGSALQVTAFQSIWSQYASSEQAAVVGLPAAQASYITTPGSYQTYLSNAAQVSCQLQAQDANTPNQYTFQQSIAIVAAQMAATAQTVNKPTITSTIASGGSNVGNPTFSTYTLNPYGVQSDTIYAEAVTITCTSASTPFSETFQAVCNAAVPSTAWNWPQGSGATQTVPITNPAATTLIQDGMFVNWGGVGNNTPLNWTILNGTAGTQVLQGTAPVRSGYSFSASIVSDGSSTTQLAQAVTLSTNIVYAFTVQMKVSATDGAGVIRIALTNGSGTILQNDAGNNLSQTYTMSSATPSSTNVGTTYATFTVFFATAHFLPATTQIQFGFSTAPSAAKTLSLDLAAGAQAVQLYNQGQFLFAVSGSVASVVGDVVTATYTNSLGTQSMVRGFQRVLNLPNLGPRVYFPSSNSPTIADSLVTNS